MRAIVQYTHGLFFLPEQEMVIYVSPFFFFRERKRENRHKFDILLRYVGESKKKWAYIASDNFYTFFFL